MNKLLSMLMLCSTVSHGLYARDNEQKARQELKQAQDLLQELPMDLVTKVGEHIEEWELVATINHNNEVVAVAISADGSRAITGSDDKTAKIINPQTGALIATINHNYWVRTVAISADGSRAITGSDDDTAQIINAQTGALIATINHNKEVR